MPEEAPVEPAESIGDTWLRVRDLLREWFAGLKVKGVSFEERFPLEYAPHEDYQVIYEAVFLPARLEQMQIEVWVTPGGSVGVGLDRNDRLAARLGLRSKVLGFADGNEPTPLTSECLLEVLNLAVAGRIAIATWCPRFMGAWPVHAFLDVDDLRRVKRTEGYHPRWLRTRRWLDGVIGQVVRYEPWS